MVKKYGKVDVLFASYAYSKKQMLDPVANSQSVEFPNVLNFNCHAFADNVNKFAGTTGKSKVLYHKIDRVHSDIHFISFSHLPLFAPAIFSEACSTSSP